MSDSELPSYDVALDDQAQAEAEQAYFSLSRRIGPEKARIWYALLLAEVRSQLSYLPRRYQVSEDGCAAYPGTEVRTYLAVGEAYGVFTITSLSLCWKKSRGLCVSCAFVMRRCALWDKRRMRRMRD